MIKKNRALTAIIAGAVALSGVGVLAATPANAAALYPVRNCGTHGKYTAGPAKTYAFTQTASGNCGTLGVRARYAYNGTTYWTGYTTGTSYVKSTPGYPVDASNNYTGYTDTITVNAVFGG